MDKADSTSCEFRWESCCLPSAAVVVDSTVLVDLLFLLEDEDEVGAGTDDIDEAELYLVSGMVGADVVILMVS